jgi:hypothetical protein
MAGAPFSCGSARQGALFALLLVALLALAVLIWSTRLTTPEDRKPPPAIRWTFLLFSAILPPVGLGMVLDNPRIFPATITPDMTKLYGWFFLGSFVYYLFGFLQPSWLNSTGHMLSFLVYDLLLIPPVCTILAGCACRIPVEPVHLPDGTRHQHAVLHRISFHRPKNPAVQDQKLF